MTEQGAAPRAAATARMRPGIPDASIARLPVYLRALNALADAGRTTVSSQELARLVGDGPAKVRRDLSHLGSYGTRGVGYRVADLAVHISAELGLEQGRAVLVVGAGNLGHALAGYGGFASRGFRVTALFDVDPARIGEVVEGCRVRHLSELDEVAAGAGVSIGVIATPAGAAQQVCDRLVEAGITSILNFAPVVLRVPREVDMRKVDLAVELQILSCHQHRRSADKSRRQELSA